MAICKTCGIKFTPKHSTVEKYHSRKCYWESLKGKRPSYSFPKGGVPWNQGLTLDDPRIALCAEKRKSGRFVSCEVCGRKRYIVTSQLKHGKYCSISCRNVGYKGKSVSTRTQFKKGQVSRIKGTHPSYMQGKNHFNWKGGRTSLKHCLRKTFEYNSWRLSIFLRDKFICQLCGKYSKKDSEADHYPLSFVQIIEKNNITNINQGRLCAHLWDINNGRTLCHDCHTKTPNYFKSNLS